MNCQKAENMKKGDSVEVFVCGNILGKHTEKWVSGVVMDYKKDKKYRPYKVQYCWHIGRTWNWFSGEKIRVKSEL